MMALDYLEKEFGDKANDVMELVYAAAEEFDGRPSEEPSNRSFQRDGLVKTDDDDEWTSL